MLSPRISVIASVLALVLAFDGRAQDISMPIVGERVTCSDGTAAGFPCNNVDLLAFLPISAIGGETVVVDGFPEPVSLNDIWGWTDRHTGNEYALVGRSDGIAFVDISDPVNPVFLGWLPSHGLDTTSSGNSVQKRWVASAEAAVRDGKAGEPIIGGADDIASSSADPDLSERSGSRSPVSIWRDVKVYRDHAYVVADNADSHGVQVFDLTQLRTVVNPPVVYEETAHYARLNSAHNIAINEETGFAYAVGSNSGGVQPAGESCGGGLHMIDIRAPTHPTFAGCFADITTGYRATGYTHDVQCVIYRGPHVEYQGKEICFGSNETAISITDVTVKSSPVAISTASYPDRAYIHQGWLTDDHRYFFQDDELDEANLDSTTRTIIWDVTDLSDPVIVTEYFGPTKAIDHNQYVVGAFVFQANYKAGLRILEISDVADPIEVGYFDTYPPEDNRGFMGAWSNYPFFKSGVVVVSSIDEGLFILDPTGPVNLHQADRETPAFGTFDLSVFPNPAVHEATVAVTLGSGEHLAISILDILGRTVRVLHEGVLPSGEHVFELDTASLPSGSYIIRAEAETFSRSRSFAVVH